MPTPTPQHTPTPWEVTGKVEEGDGEVSIVSTTEQEEVCQVFGGDAIEANAHHIVHCVNTHAALVVALEASLLAIPDGMTSNTSPICQQIRAALAQERSAP